MQNLISNLRALAKPSLLTGLILLSAAELRAATFTVNTTSDTHAVDAAGHDSSGNISLRSAIEAANGQSGASTINIPASTNTLSLGELSVSPNGSKTLVISGAGAATTIIKQGDGVNRVFNIDVNSDGNTVTSISGVTIEGGTDKHDNFGGAGILAGSLFAPAQDSLTLNGCIIQNNACHALGNSSANPGGGVSMQGGSLSIVNCTFQNNSSASSQGGAVYFFPQSVASTLTVSGSTFNQNSIADTTGAGIGGSAIGIGSSAANVTHTITQSQFTDNSVTGTFTGSHTYGAIQVSDSGSGNVLNITACIFTGNSVSSGPSGSGLGAALAVNSGHVTVGNCRFFNNTATAGSAIFSSVANSAVVGATENWWGCNGGPGASGCQTIVGDGAGGSFGTTVTFNPWLVLTFTPNTSPINTGNSTVLTASFLKDSAGSTLSASSVSVMDALPIAFGNPSLGTLSGAQTAIQNSGTATVTFTAGASAGIGHADATVDNATATANITINSPLTVTGNPSDTAVCNGSTATFSASATGTPTPTLQWQVSVGGGAFANIPNATTSPLSITATTADDGNQYRAVFSSGGNTVNSSAATLTVNAQPVAGTDTLGTIQDVAVKAPVAKLLANDSSPIGGTLSITGVSSPTAAGGTAVLSGPSITYTPKAGFFGSDSFTYTLSDTRCTATGTVNVVVTSANAPSLNNLSVTVTVTGRVVLFSGIPGVSYVVQHSANADGPWASFPDGTIIAGPTGLIQYTDTTSPVPPTQFYRTQSSAGP
jgi:hypothetical protein